MRQCETIWERNKRQGLTYLFYYMRLIASSGSSISKWVYTIRMDFRRIRTNVCNNFLQLFRKMNIIVVNVTKCDMEHLTTLGI